MSETLTWEYRVTDLMAVDEMNGYGAHGWEVVAVYPQHAHRKPALIWKRPLVRGVYARHAA